MKIQNKTLKQLKALRLKIDQTDYVLFKALSKRFKYVQKVGKIKKKFDLPILQKDRWEEIVKDRLKLGKKISISEDFTRNLLKLIHHESIQLQQRKTKS